LTLANAMLVSINSLATLICAGCHSLMLAACSPQQ